MRTQWHETLAVALMWSAGSQPLVGQPVDGRWRSEGYGLYFEVSGAALTAYEITEVSCLPAFAAKRVGDDGDGGVRFAVVDRPTTYIFRSGGSANRRLIHMNGAASDIVIHRANSAPALCAQPTGNTPLTNFDVFAQTWAEQYGFFDLKHADWRATTSRQRQRVTDRTAPHELFEILRDMIEPFEDAHTSIRGEDIGESWSGTRKSATWLERAERARAFEVTEQKYLRGPLRSWCNGQVQYRQLDSGVAYLRLKSFSGYGAAPGFESGLAALEEALDAIFADARSWSGLVIDVRINGGGEDPYGLAIASRLTASSYVAYAKQARSDPRDASKWTSPQPSIVRPSSRPSFHGAVVELIGIHSVSAAETFTQALLKRTPKVIRVGENTQGVFSDVLGRHLPNGWRFGLPNERFVTDGKSYDGVGIAPDVPVPVFPKADLDAGRDGALEKALALLARRPVALREARA
jgi:C-terminal processing protease CtpA/Prc